MKRAALVVLLASSAAGLAGSDGTVVVVCRAGGPAADLSAEQVRAIYSGRTLRGGDASKVYAIDYADNPPIRDTFYREISGRNGTQMDSFWVQHVFSGAGRAPTRVRDAAEMFAVVESDPRALGFTWEVDLAPGLVVVDRIQAGGGR